MNFAIFFSIKIFVYYFKFDLLLNSMFESLMMRYDLKVL